MKDNELREYFDKLDNLIKASASTIVGGDTKEVIDRMQERLDRIQELVEAGHRFEMPPIKLPSAAIPVTVGLVVGALLFAAGMLTEWLMR